MNREDWRTSEGKFNKELVFHFLIMCICVVAGPLLLVSEIHPLVTLFGAIILIKALHSETLCNIDISENRILKKLDEIYAKNKQD